MSFEAVVLAGGKGTRLSPFTYVLPKPLLPLGQRPILDIVLTQLARAGCTKVTLAIGHLGHYIEIYCGDGERWGLEVVYFREATPLGTVGALAQIAPPNAPFLVMNGDVLSDVSLAELIDSHERAGAELTIGSFRRTERDELGVIDADANGRVTGYTEKPEHAYLVSMGIYALSPSVIDTIPPGGRMDFPDLVHELLSQGREVRAHIHAEFWLDLGRADDFTRANEDAAEILARLGIDG